MTMTRKEFLRSLLGAGAGAVGVAVIAGCGGDDGGGGGMPDAPNVPLTCASPNVVIGTNHGHMMIVSQTEVDAAAAKTYNIMGTSLHDHTVTISAAQFAMLKTGTMLSIESSTGSGHTHTITVACLT